MTFLSDPADLPVPVLDIPIAEPKIVTDAERLSGLLVEIRQLHRDHLVSVRNGFVIAAKLGERLIEAKELVGHGEWLPWLRENTMLNPKRAQRYMKAHEIARDIAANEGFESELFDNIWPKLSDKALEAMTQAYERYARGKPPKVPKEAKAPKQPPLDSEHFTAHMQMRQATLALAQEMTEAELREEFENILSEPRPREVEVESDSSPTTEATLNLFLRIVTRAAQSLRIQLVSVEVTHPERTIYFGDPDQPEPKSALLDDEAPPFDMG